MAASTSGAPWRRYCAFKLHGGSDRDGKYSYHKNNELRALFRSPRIFRSLPKVCAANGVPPRCLVAGAAGGIGWAGARSVSEAHHNMRRAPSLF
jgi:hypothetical protein